MSRDNQVVHEAGDLVRVVADITLERDDATIRMKDRFAIVVDGDSMPIPGGLLPRFLGQVPIRFADDVKHAWWIKPEHLELVRRGGQ